MSLSWYFNMANLLHWEREASRKYRLRVANQNDGNEPMTSRSPGHRSSVLGRPVDWPSGDCRHSERPHWRASRIEFQSTADRSIWPSYRARPMMQPNSVLRHQVADVVQRRHAAGGDHGQAARPRPGPPAPPRSARRACRRGRCRCRRSRTAASWRTRGPRRGPTPRTSSASRGWRPCRRGRRGRGRSASGYAWAICRTQAGSCRARVPRTTRATPSSSVASMSASVRSPPPTWHGTSTASTIRRMTSPLTGLPALAPSRSTRWRARAPSDTQRRAMADRVVAEDGLLGVIALLEPDALAAAQVDRRQDQHGVSSVRDGVRSV